MAPTTLADDTAPIYKDTATGTLAKVLDKPEPFGTPTHELESKQVKLESLDDGTWYTVYYDKFRSNFVKVADSEDDLDD